MSERSREEIQTQAALYALDALTEHEADAFEKCLAEDGGDYAKELQAFESIVGALGFDAPEVKPSAHLRERLFEKLAETPPPARPASAAPALDPFIVTRFQAIEWRACAPGIHAKVLFKDPQAHTVTTLYKFDPGVTVGKHSHTGFEQCFILQGDFVVNGESYGPGDYHCAPPGSTHELITSTQGALVLIVASDDYRATS